MALTLPVNFSKDIEGRETALVPIVIIGNIHISTNSLTFDGQYYKPLLLNIPSLKESIDLEKRNYKINNLSLSISNYKHEFERFSELVKNSLINTEVWIYWISPSGQTISDALLVFKGQVRQYTHDDEKVSISVEDRSQITLHKDLPLQEHYLGDEDHTPERYKNKPKPMVYGEVDRSPCVIDGIVPDFEIDEESVEVPRYIICDSDNTVQTMISSTQIIAGWTGVFYESQLYVYENGTYVNVLRQDAHLDDHGISDDAFIDPYGTDSPNVIQLNYQGSSVIAKTGNLLARIPRVIDKVVFQIYHSTGFDAEQDSAYSGGFFATAHASLGGAEQDFDVDGGPLGSVNLGDFKEAVMDSDTNSYIRMQGKISDVQTHWAYFYFHLKPLDLSFKCSTFLIIKVGKEHDVGGDVGFLDWDVDYGVTGNEPLHPPHDVFASALGDADNTRLEGHYNQDLKRMISGWSGDDATISNYTGFRIGTPNHTSNNWGENWYPYKLKVYEAHLFQEAFIDNVAGRDFYVKIKGRNIHQPTSSPHNERDRECVFIIKHLLETELGFEGDVDINAPILNDGYLFDWFNDFTIIEKINSKKLIETIASTTPYIPRINYLGNFKLDEIPLDGGTAQHTINNADVIDFSFSRTKPDDIYTKVEFKFKLDYGSGEFSRELDKSVEVDALFANYSFDYYGLKDDHSDSTLIIDDDRGKYIRDGNTARKFAWWMLSWHCNQHIKMKVKLPLKYLNLEVADIINFDSILGDINPYGIKYTSDQYINGNQIAYSNFIITSTTKSLDSMEIECIQLHKLYIDECEAGLDCNGVCNGEVSDCGECVSGNFDCEGICDGLAVEDECGVCNGDGAIYECGCVDIAEGECDCDGNVLDICGICGGDGSSCDDCLEDFGLPCGSTYDEDGQYIGESGCHDYVCGSDNCINVEDIQDCPEPNIPVDICRIFLDTTHIGTFGQDALFTDSNTINAESLAIDVSQYDLDSGSYILNEQGLRLEWIIANVESMVNLEGSGLLEASDIRIKMEAVNQSSGILDVYFAYETFTDFTGVNIVNAITQVEIIPAENPLFDITFTDESSQDDPERDTEITEDQHFKLKLTAEYKINSTDGVDEDDPNYWFINNDYVFTRIINIPISISASSVNAGSGDINQDGSVDVMDIIPIVSFILEGEGVLTDEQMEIADVNGDGNVDVLDIIQIMNLIMGLGTVPPYERIQLKQIPPTDEGGIYSEGKPEDDYKSERPDAIPYPDTEGED